MKSAPHSTSTKSAGMTLLEMTVVICVIMGLLSILFIGARAWKKGSDRAGCVINMRTVQWAVRSYQNLGGYSPGSHLYAYEQGQDILELLHSKEFLSDELHQIAKGQQECPGGGTCTTEATNTFPPLGQLFMTCSLAENELHAPKEHLGW